MTWMNSWAVMALLSAFFASLTAIFGKIGVAGVSSNLATCIRTVIILLLTLGIVAYEGSWKNAQISNRTWIFLVLSGLATGLSWLFYYRALQVGLVSRVAPLDKVSLAFTILLAVVILGEPLTWKVALGGGLMLLGAIVLSLG